MERPTVTKKRRLRGACDMCKLKKTRCDSATMPDHICSNCIAYNEKCTHDIVPVKKPPKQPTFNFVNYAGPSSRSTTVESDLDAQIGRILATPAVLPTDLPTAQHLIRDLALRVRELDAELATCRKVLAQNLAASDRSTSVSAAASPAESPASAQPNVDEDVSTVIKDKTDLVLTDSLKRLTIGQSRHRHWGKSSVIMLMKNAMDIKKELTGNPEGLAFSAKRGLFWNNQPWQRALHEKDDYIPPYSFPEDDLLHTLINWYFQEDDHLIGLVYRPNFERRVAQGLHEHDRSFGAVVLAVCAIGARYCGDPRVLLTPSHEHSAGWQWFKQIRPLPSSFSAPTTLFDLQMYLLSSYYSNGTTVPESSWALPGFGIRMAQAVGAHRRKPEGGQMTIEDEEWKRAFWAIWCMDIWSCITTGRPLGTTTDDYDLDYPVQCDYEFWDNVDPRLMFKQPAGLPSTTSHWTYYLQLHEILSYAHRNIYAVRRSELSSDLAGPDFDKKLIVALDSALNRWVDSIPEFLRWNPHQTHPTFFKQSMVLYATYYFTQIQVHRPFIMNVGSADGGVNATVSFPSLAICVNAARACCHVVDMYHKRGFLPACVNQIQIFYSAIILLMNIWRNKRMGSPAQVEKDLANVHRCLDVLSIHETRWQLAGRHQDMIRALLADLESVPTAGAVGGSANLKRGRDRDDTIENVYPTPPPMHVEWAHPYSSPPSQYSDKELYDLPLYTDELGRPSPPRGGETVPQESSYDYAGWFQQNFPLETLTGIPPEHVSWEHPGRLSGGFLTSFMGDTDTQYHIQQTPNFNALDQEMASWFTRMPQT